jgi:hypothetical protein
MSGEVQANKFARGLLSPAHVVCEYDSWEEIALWCKIPDEIAQEAYRLHGRRMLRPVPEKLKSIFDQLNHP